MGRKGLEDRVVCGREGERRGKERRKKRGNESISLYYSPSTPLRGLHPAGIHSPTTLQTHYHSTPIHRTQTQKWGIPTSSPPGEREEKEEEKGTFYTYYPLFFSLGENPQTPLLTGTRKKKTRKARARVNLTSRTKSIDLNETS